MRLNYASTLLCIPVLSFINVALSQARNPYPMPPVHLRHKRLDSSIDVVGTVTSVALISPSIFLTSVSVPTLTATLPPVSFPAPTTTESGAGPSSAPTTPTPQSVPAFTSQPQAQATTSSVTSATGHSSTTTAATSPTSTSTSLAPVAQQSAYSGFGGSGDSAGTTVTISTSAPSSSSSAAGQSSSGFFSNTGVVAGTFTIAGLFGLAGVIGVGMFIAKRRRSTQYDDDIEFFDKQHVEPEPHVQSRHTMEDDPTSTEMGHYGDPMSSSTPPATYYPNYGYDATHAPHIQADYYDQHPYAAQEYGLSHPENQGNLPNPHDFVTVDLNQTHTNTGDIPSVSQPSNQQTGPVGSPTDPRRSLDSFYAGITDTPGVPGEAL